MSSCLSATSWAARMALITILVSAISSFSMSLAPTNSLLLSLMVCSLLISLIEWSVLPPILRTRSASSSVVA